MTEPIPFESVHLELWHPYIEDFGTIVGPGCEVKANQTLRDLCTRIPFGKLWRVFAKITTPEGAFEVLVPVTCTETPSGLRGQLVSCLEGMQDDALPRSAGPSVDVIRSLTGTPDQLAHGQALARHVADHESEVRGLCGEGRAEYNAELQLMLRLGYLPCRAIEEARHAAEDDVPTEPGWTPDDTAQRAMGIHLAWREARSFLETLQDVNA